MTDLSNLFQENNWLKSNSTKELDLLKTPNNSIVNIWFNDNGMGTKVTSIGVNYPEKCYIVVAVDYIFPRIT